jgi:hypothetical protein
MLLWKDGGGELTDPTSKLAFILSARNLASTWPSNELTADQPGERIKLYQQQ